MGDPRAIEPAISALSAGDAEVRVIAVRALGWLRDPRTVVPLIACRQDEDRMVRGPAAHALQRQGDLRAVEPLIAALKDEDGWVRSRAASALGTLGDKRAVEPLRASLRNKDGHVSSDAAVALAYLVKDVSAIEPLLAALRNPDNEETAFMVADAFCEIGTPAVEPVIAVLKGVNKRRREAAARPRSGAPDPLQVISEDTLCAGIAWALLMMPDPRMLEPFIDLLKNPRIAQIAALGLVALDDKRAVAPLTAASKDQDEQVRGAAAEALRQLASKP